MDDIYEILGEINSTLSRKIRDKYSVHTSHSENCTLYINSGGGNVASAIYILCFLKSKYKKLTAIILDDCFSAAAWIASACDVIKDNHNVGLGWHCLRIYFPDFKNNTMKIFKATKLYSTLQGKKLYENSLVFLQPLLHSKEISTDIKRTIVKDTDDVILSAKECEVLRKGYTKKYMVGLIKEYL